MYSEKSSAGMQEEAVGLRSIDIMVERGRRAMLWPGNIRYVELIQEFVPKYQVAKSHSCKASVVGQVMNRIAENGARFVKKRDNCEDESYEQISDELTKKKVGQTLRHYLRQYQSKAQSRYKRSSDAKDQPKKGKKSKKTFKKKAIRDSSSTMIPATGENSSLQEQPAKQSNVSPRESSGRHCTSMQKPDVMEQNVIASFGRGSTQQEPQNAPTTTAFKLPGIPDKSLVRMISHDIEAKMCKSTTLNSIDETRAEEAPVFLEFGEKGGSSSLLEDEANDDSPAVLVETISRSIFEEVAPIDPVYPRSIPMQGVISDVNEDFPCCFPGEHDHQPGSGAAHQEDMMVSTKSASDLIPSTSYSFAHMTHPPSFEEIPSVLPSAVIMQATADEESFDDDEFLRKIESTIGWP